jgi:hypothetical protein
LRVDDDAGVLFSAQFALSSEDLLITVGSRASAGTTTVATQPSAILTINRTSYRGILIGPVGDRSSTPVCGALRRSRALRIRAGACRLLTTEDLP